MSNRPTSAIAISDYWKRSGLIVNLARSDTCSMAISLSLRYRAQSLWVALYVQNFCRGSREPAAPFNGRFTWPTIDLRSGLVTVPMPLRTAQAVPSPGLGWTDARVPQRSVYPRARCSYDHLVMRSPRHGTRLRASLILICMRWIDKPVRKSSSPPGRTGKVLARTASSPGNGRRPATCQLTRTTSAKVLASSAHLLLGASGQVNRRRHGKTSLPASRWKTLQTQYKDYDFAVASILIWRTDCVYFFPWEATGTKNDNWYGENISHLFSAYR